MNQSNHVLGSVFLALNVAIVGCSGEPENAAKQDGRNETTSPSDQKFQEALQDVPLKDVALNEYGVSDDADDFTKASLEAFRELQNDGDFHFVVVKESDEKEERTLHVCLAKKLFVAVESIKLEDAASLTTANFTKEKDGESDGFQVAKLIARESKPITSATELQDSLQTNPKSVIVTSVPDSANEGVPTQLVQALGFSEGVSEIRFETSESDEEELIATFLGPIYVIEVKVVGDKWQIESIAKSKEES